MQADRLVALRYGVIEDSSELLDAVVHPGDWDWTNYSEVLARTATGSAAIAGFASR